MNFKNSDAIFIENALTLLTGGAAAGMLALILVILA
jgi:hypothetical protein